MLIWYFGNQRERVPLRRANRAGQRLQVLAGRPGRLPLLPGCFRRAWPTNRSDNPGPGGIFGALVAEGHPDFMTLLADRIQKHFFTGGALTPERNLARLNARMDEIQQRHGLRVCPLGLPHAGKLGQRRREHPHRVCSRSGPTFCSTICAPRGLFPSVDAPVLARHGGSGERGVPAHLRPDQLARSISPSTAATRACPAARFPPPR